MSNWRDHWKPTGDKSRQGNQGTITQVRHVIDGTIGALKQLHPANASNTERRYRMQQEVNALRAQKGIGVPLVLESNADNWNRNNESLYVVMSWIEGPTLADHISGHFVTLDEALLVTRRLLTIIDQCHKLDIYHRDLKPDNVILRNGDASDPVLVDFGMSWARPPEGDKPEFQTEVGQELGNRFLRLPEYAPGVRHHDSRSDLTMLVGVLLYMVSGRAPRVLTDSNGRKPHESIADELPASLIEDPRWPRLRRLFGLAFQDRLDLRIQTAAELIDRLEHLAPPTTTSDEVDVEAEHLKELLASEVATQLAADHSQLQQAMEAFLDVFQKRARAAGFAAGGTGPNIVDTRVGDISFFILRPGTSQPQASFRHVVTVEGSQFVASRWIEGEVPAQKQYYRGPRGDPESLIEAVRQEALRILTQLIRVYTSKIERQLQP